MFQGAILKLFMLQHFVLFSTEAISTSCMLSIHTNTPTCFGLLAMHLFVQILLNYV